jgi:hypothetical protein
MGKKWGRKGEEKGINQLKIEINFIRNNHFSYMLTLESIYSLSKEYANMLEISMMYAKRVNTNLDKIVDLYHRHVEYEKHKTGKYDVQTIDDLIVESIFNTKLKLITLGFNEEFDISIDITPNYGKQIPNFFNEIGITYCDE